MRINFEAQNKIQYKGRIKQFFIKEIEDVKRSNELRAQFLEKAKDENERYRIKTASINHILRIKELHDLGLSLDDAYSYSHNDGKLYRDIKEIAINGNFDRYIELKKLSVPNSEHQNYFELSNEEFEKAINLLKNNIDFYTAVSFAKKYKEKDIEIICDFGRTEQIYPSFMPYFIEKQNADSRFSSKNIIELTEQKIFSERLISEILINDKKDEILNSETLIQTSDILRKLKEKQDKFFAIAPRQVDYVKGEIPYESYDFLINNLFGIYDIDLKEYSCDKKTSIYFELLSVFNSGIFSHEEMNKIKLPQLLMVLYSQIVDCISTVKVKQEDIRNFFVDFIANNNSSIDKTMINFDYSKYEKNGLPLLYPRDDYFLDLNKILSQLSNERRDELYKKLEITPVFHEDKMGYDGIINLDKLNLDDEVEKQIHEISKRFILENEVITEDKNFNKIVNSIIKGIPEFVNIIGKKQHRAQTLDIHTFLVLKNLLADQSFQNLSPKNKTILKISALLHDISKQEFVVDSKHSTKSSLYAKSILKRFDFDSGFKRNVVDIILNHHWLADFDHGSLTPNRIAFKFRDGDNFEMAKILTEADLKGVNYGFYQAHRHQLFDSKIKQISEKIKQINSNGQLVFSNKIINSDKIPKIKYKNREFRVVDFSKYDSKYDLSKIGFEPNVDKNNLRLLVHMAECAHELETTMALNELDVDCLLCASYISLKNKPTYYRMSYGLSLDSDFAGVINSNKSNQASGRRKGNAHLDHIIDQDVYREKLSKDISKYAGLSKEDYGNLYYQLSAKRYLSQIPNNRIYSLNNENVSGNVVKNSIRKANDKLLGRFHNEVNLYKPRVNAFVAKVESIDEIPDDFLDFVYKHNLPILILGK